jgi:hypothetical protein
MLLKYMLLMLLLLIFYCVVYNSTPMEPRGKDRLPPTREPGSPHFAQQASAEKPLGYPSKKTFSMAL